MPEIIADNISVINSDELEGTTRLDAEYYQPEYLNIEGHLLNTAKYKLWKDINGKFITGPFGSSFNVENYVSYPPYRYIRGKDVKDFFLLDDDNVYIPEKDFERLRKYVLYEGDILISVVGTLGNAVIVDKNNIPAVFSCKSTAFRTEALNPFFLIAYLNCLFGKKLLLRKVRGAVQTGLNIDDLKLLPIYLPNTESQNKIAKFVIDAKNNLEQSNVLYSQAEALLLGELGIKDIDLSHDPCYEVDSADTIAANRIDAEFYKPKYSKLFSIIQKKAKYYRQLREFRNFNTRGSQPIYAREGILKVINSKHILEQHLDYENFERTHEQNWNLQREARVFKYDILTYTTGANVGRANIYFENDKALASNHVNILRLREENPIYVGVVLNSMIGRLQTRRLVTGSAQVELYPGDIDKFIIPFIDTKKQEHISSLVKESYRAKREAKALLEEAKNKVEDMIEKDAK